MSLRLLLVEDDRSLGATLFERLGKEGYSVVWKSTVAEALHEHAQRAFDLYVLDVGLPDGTGFDLARAIVAQGGPRPLVFLTAQGDAESRLQGYELGAEEYIPKPFHLRELLLRIRHVVENHSAPQRLRFGDTEIDFDSYTLARAGRRETLPSKDMQLLKLLIGSSPKVISRDEILNLLWGEDKFPTPRTIDNSILRLRAALGESLADCIESVRGVGYRWTPPSEKEDKT